MNRIALVSLALAILGCGGFGGMKRDANAALREEARAKFVTACARTGASTPACTCAADEILATHSTKELIAYAADPTAKEVAPIVAACARKLAR